MSIHLTFGHNNLQKNTLCAILAATHLAHENLQMGIFTIFVRIETRSRVSHSTIEEIRADREKYKTLKSMGWKVFSFTAAEATNLTSFNFKSEEIYKVLGKRFVKPDAKFAQRQKMLFDSLY